MVSGKVEHFKSVAMVNEKALEILGQRRAVPFLPKQRHQRIYVVGCDLFEPHFGTLAAWHEDRLAAEQIRNLQAYGRIML